MCVAGENRQEFLKRLRPLAFVIVIGKDHRKVLETVKEADGELYIRRVTSSRGTISSVIKDHGPARSRSSTSVSLYRELENSKFVFSTSAHAISLKTRARNCFYTNNSFKFQLVYVSLNLDTN